MRHPFRPALLLCLLVLCLLPSFAQAQATRTWVSGVGDDANPCSRTAPCRTFAGAISKTAAGGVISVLDPGSYGAVTITKAITLEAEGDIAGDRQDAICRARAAGHRRSRIGRGLGGCGAEGGVL